MTTAHSLALDARVCLTKARALSTPTPACMAAYGHAVMDCWDANATTAWHPHVRDHVRVLREMSQVLTCPELPHSTAEYGHTGTVYAEKPPQCALDHPFLVVFDKPVPKVVVRGSVISLHTQHYTAAELEQAG